MVLMKKVCRSLLPSLAIAALLSCGEPAGRSAAYRPATAADPSPPKGGDPVGALPSQVVSGEVAVFEAGAASTGPRKSRDTAGSLPSVATAGRSAAYAPAGRAGAGGTRDAAGLDGEAATTLLRGLPP